MPHISQTNTHIYTYSPTHMHTYTHATVLATQREDASKDTCTHMQSYAYIHLHASHFNHPPYGCGSKCKVWIKPRSHKRSRPLIQTPNPDLSKGVDPDLWNDIIYGRVDVCSYSPCQAAKQQTVLKPSCQASKLHLLQSHAAKQSSCQAAKLHVLLSHAFKLSNCNCSQATKLSSYQADTVARPGCQAAKVSTCCLHLVVLFLSHCIQAATCTKKWVQF